MVYTVLPTLILHLFQAIWIFFGGGQPTPVSPGKGDPDVLACSLPDAPMEDPGHESQDVITGFFFRPPDDDILMSNVQTLKRHMAIRSQSGLSNHDITPHFFIWRQDGTKVPLIALDELPTGLKIGKPNWFRSYWLKHMVPVSQSRYPKPAGEYGVTIQAGVQLTPATTSSSDGDKKAPDLIECCLCARTKVYEGGGCNECIITSKARYGRRIKKKKKKYRRVYSLVLPLRNMNTPPNSVFTPRANGDDTPWLRYYIQKGLDNMARNQQKSPCGSSAASESPSVDSGQTAATSILPDTIEQGGPLNRFNSIQLPLRLSTDPVVSRRPSSA